ncbi:hypothetical protein [Streptomyces yangpuensis]|uniref:hypothetical protein n=1 Tax=Streptomyces yangpuensis TaxID=1648182 RepID=UPI0038246B14
MRPKMAKGAPHQTGAALPQLRLSVSLEQLVEGSQVGSEAGRREGRPPLPVEGLVPLDEVVVAAADGPGGAEDLLEQLLDLVPLARVGCPAVRDGLQLGPLGRGEFDRSIQQRLRDDAGLLLLERRRGGRGRWCGSGGLGVADAAADSACRGGEDNSPTGTDDCDSPSCSPV